MTLLQRFLFPWVLLACMQMHTPDALHAWAHGHRHTLGNDGLEWRMPKVDCPHFDMQVPHLIVFANAPAPAIIHLAKPYFFSFHYVFFSAYHGKKRGRAPPKPILTILSHLASLQRVDGSLKCCKKVKLNKNHETSIV